jgi:hypothetical protein
MIGRLFAPFLRGKDHLGIRCRMVAITNLTEGELGPVNLLATRRF